MSRRLARAALLLAVTALAGCTGGGDEGRRFSGAYGGISGGVAR